jgi:hypothetical protein
VNFLLLASRMAPDAVLSHHSALEAHGYAQSVYERFYLLARRGAGNERGGRDRV